MDKHRSFFLALTLTILGSLAILISAGESRIGVYVSVFAICYFACSEIFRPRRRTVDFVGIFLFIAFVILVTFKAAEVLGYGW